MILRVVIIGAGRSHKNEAAIGRAVESLGLPSLVINAVTWTQNLGRLAAPLLQRRIEAFEPDVLICSRHALLLGEARLRSLFRGRYSAFWYFDLRIPPIKDVITLGRLVDTMYTTYAPQVEVFRQHGIERVLHLPQGMDPELDRPAPDPIPAAFRCDVVFVGSGKFENRFAVLRAVSGVAKLHIRGTDWERAPADMPVVGGPVYGPAYAQTVSGAAISLGANSLPEMAAQHGSASNRMWKVMGCGGFYLGEWVEGLDAFARHGEHCAWYRQPGEAAELARYYLDRPDERRAIAAAGREHALAHHTYAHRVRLLLDRRGYDAASPQTMV
ncbi:MAG TPA: glycosyltransferase [Gemmatimonadales bacterium]|jgi:spore maturation protein CgeB|nr:glycosyltransferase [Gemmatimonadales bacterium]